jgi:L-ascorbate metabolism protein UlaG (beta-lactamase superfamily)
VVHALGPHNPAKAVQAHFELDSRQSIGMHFGTFPLTSEGLEEPLRALERARVSRDVPESRLRALEFGESVRWRNASIRDK